MHTFNKAMLIYNEHAGDEDVEAKLAAVVPVLGKAVKELTIVSPESSEETRLLCETADDTELIAIMGGDGTVHQCIDAISKLDVRPLLAILPGGTSNDFTRTLGIPQNLRDATEALLSGEIRTIDVGREGNQHFINFWGIGLVADTSKNVDEGQKKSLGPLSYIASTIRTMREAESFPYHIVSSGIDIEGEAIAIFVLNGNSLATTPIPIGAISPSDAKLDVLVVKNSNLAMLRELMSLRKSETDATQLNMLEYMQVSELQIDAPSQRRVDMDGELYDFRSGRIQLLPGHLRMLVPTIK
ncbi:diacylglycerol kinase family lipid kinase [Sporosarcina aquimarina]|uniref:diacylglycerol/lipid kinase family protein n=1 Tax=Sporosarcina aquimarina TaxID=114975 RepID=UPI00203BCDEE|nr:diacylglycerol kinase family protein [Sporosarcina aquimarina]MCM3756280.1 diacylglycerol kinase family lipid kinase [Sporosarcina aquimarina]